AHPGRVHQPPDLCGHVCRLGAVLVRRDPAPQAPADDAAGAVGLDCGRLLVRHHDVQLPGLRRDDQPRRRDRDRRGDPRPVGVDHRPISRADPPGALLRRWRHPRHRRQLLQHRDRRLADRLGGLPAPRRAGRAHGAAPRARRCGRGLCRGQHRRLADGGRGRHPAGALPRRERRAALRLLPAVGCHPGDDAHAPDFGRRRRGPHHRRGNHLSPAHRSDPAACGRARRRCDRGRRARARHATRALDAAADRLPGARPPVAPRPPGERQRLGRVGDRRDRRGTGAVPDGATGGRRPRGPGVGVRRTGGPYRRRGRGRRAAGGERGDPRGRPGARGRARAGPDRAAARRRPSAVPAHRGADGGPRRAIGPPALGRVVGRADPRLRPRLPAQRGGGLYPLRPRRRWAGDRGGLAHRPALRAARRPHGVTGL
ncbi:MAG: Substrate-specific component NikM of nickel ECF transporter, partial [uncultured Thermomicrobiales bacterium]